MTLSKLQYKEKYFIKINITLRTLFLMFSKNAAVAVVTFYPATFLAIDILGLQTSVAKIKSDKNVGLYCL